jgi:hypothetical protein
VRCREGLALSRFSIWPETARCGLRALRNESRLAVSIRPKREAIGKTLNVIAGYLRLSSRNSSASTCTNGFAEDYAQLERLERAKQTGRRRRDRGLKSRFRSPHIGHQGITDKESGLSLSVYCRARFALPALPPQPKQARTNVGRCPRFDRRLCRTPGPLFPMPTIKQVSNR